MDKLSNRIIRLQDMLIDEQVSKEDYANIKSSYNQGKSKLEAELSELKGVRIHQGTQLKCAMEILSGLDRLYDQSSIEVKHQLVDSIFPEKLSFDGTKCRTPRVNEVLRLILLKTNRKQSLKKGNLTKNLVVSPMVELKGFEPLTP